MNRIFIILLFCFVPNAFSQVLVNEGEDRFTGNVGERVAPSSGYTKGV